MCYRVNTLLTAQTISLWDKLCYRERRVGRVGKIHKSLRLDESIADRVKGSMLEGETETAAYIRMIEAGLDAVGGGDGTTWHNDGAKDVSALRDHMETLKAVNAELLEQLKIKDAQIESMTEITRAAQTLHAMGNAHKLIDEPEADRKKRRSLKEWLFG